MYYVNACRTVAFAIGTWGRQRSTKIVGPITRSPCDVTPYPPFKKQVTYFYIYICNLTTEKP